MAHFDNAKPVSDHHPMNMAQGGVAPYTPHAL